MNPFYFDQNITQRIESVFTRLKKIEFFPVWLTELNLFFFLKKTNPFSLNITKELDSYFLNMTQGIEPLISWRWRKELNRLIFAYDSKNWNYFWMTQRIELLYMTQRMEPFFWIWLRELNFLINKTITQRNEPFFISLTELNPFSLNMTKELDSFFLNLTQRIGPFFQIWLQEMNFFQNMTHRIEPFFLNLTHRIELFLVEYDSTNWTLFLLTQRLVFFQCDTKSFFFLQTWLWAFNPFEKFDSRIRLFLKKTMTHRMEPFFSIWLKELNPFQNIAQRTEPLSTYDSKNWTLFQNITHRIEPFSTCDSKNWTFFSKELFQYDSKDEIFQYVLKSWTLFCFDLKNWQFLEKWVKYLNPFWKWLKELNFFHMIQIIEPYFEKRLTELNFLKLLSELSFFFEKNQRIERIEPFLDITQRIELFFVEHMTQRTWTFFFLNLTQRIAPTFFFMVQILGPFSHDSKNWTFSFTWLKYLNFFKEMDPFF